MALNFSTEDMTCDESITHTIVGERKYWSQETQSMAFATMSVGINKITETTAPDFYHRYLSLCVAQGQEPFLSEQLVRAFIGFRTNASTITPAAFNKQLLVEIQATADRKLSNERARLADPNAPQLL